MEERICIFGDSIVWGAIDIEKNGWVNRLAIYCENDENNNCYIYNLGIPSETTKDLLVRIKQEAKTRNPTKIVIAIGINDTKITLDNQMQKTDKITFSKNINELINISKRLVSNVVFIGLTKVLQEKCNPVVWNDNESYKNECIFEYNNIIKKVCDTNNVKFIDIFDLLSNEDLSEDGIHPNSNGHEKIFEYLKDKIL